MKYPFSPQLLDALPEELAELFRELESTLLAEICGRLALKDQLNQVTLEDIRALRAHGVSLDEIKRAIEKATGIGEKKLGELLEDAVQWNQQYYSESIDAVGLTQPGFLVSAEDIAAIVAQCQEEYHNITRSLGFLVDNGRTMLEPAASYQWALDNAAMQIQSGAISYEQAIKNAVKQLADSGMRTVDYESGHTDQVDVAVRRAVMTGVNQLCAKYTEQSAEQLGTHYFEISAHIGARDKPGVSPWASHKAWQGKVYSTQSGDKYPNIFEVCGLGYVDGLEGANCRHRRFVFIDGFSERAYTDEQLAHIDDGHDVTYDGKHYSAYEATQMQRRMERTIRKLKREKTAYQAAGLKEDAQATNIRIRRLNQKYTEFSRAAGLPEYNERKRVTYPAENPPASLQKSETSIASRDHAVIIRGKENGGGDGVQTIGKIDVEKYKVVTEEIRTDEVVITDERIQHIQDRHPNDYERFAAYIPMIIDDPDYIIEANKEHTAVLLKEVVEDNFEKFKLILRLSIPKDPVGYKNSVISFWKIGDATWRKTLKNKKVLYKKE